ncbi:MAG: QueT transporter family protein [Oscillospiraceae bacterium]|nr:QueT transporter family protein [Oscillospiraceae bacterium]
MSVSARKIVFAAVTAAAYAALTMLPPFSLISYGAVQFRVSEALCVLPFFIPCSAWGLFIGCATANLISAAGPADIVFGSAATLAASLCAAGVGKRANAAEAEGKPKGRMRYRVAVCTLPVVFNGPVIGAVLAYTSSSPGAFLPSFALFGAQVALGEAGVMFALGLPLIRLLPKIGAFSAAAEKFR